MVVKVVNALLIRLWYTGFMTTVTISRKLAPKDDFIVIPKKEFDALVARARYAVTEQDVLQWSRDAKKMRRAGKLAKLS